MFVDSEAGSLHFCEYKHLHHYLLTSSLQFQSIIALLVAIIISTGTSAREGGVCKAAVMLDYDNLKI